MCANPTRPALWRIQRCIKVWVYWMAVFVQPTSKNLCMDDQLVRFTTCLAAMDAQLLSICQDCSGVEDSPVVNNSRIE